MSLMIHNTELKLKTADTKQTDRTLTKCFFVDTRKKETYLFVVLSR